MINTIISNIPQLIIATLILSIITTIILKPKTKTIIVNSLYSSLDPDGQVQCWVKCNDNIKYRVRKSIFTTMFANNKYEIEYTSFFKLYTIIKAIKLTEF
jgi:hypothetical protein